MRQRIRRTQPLVRYDLGAIVRDGLAGRRLGDEEAGVEAFGAVERREPMAQIGEPIHRQTQPALCTELAQRALAAVQRAAPRLQHCQGAALQRLAVGANGKQQPRLFETLAQRRHLIVQPTLVEAELCTDEGIVAAGAVVPVAVAPVDDAAGEYPGPAVAVAAFGAQQQQHLHAGGRVANHYQRRSGPRWIGRADSNGSGLGCDGRHGVRETVARIAANYAPRL